MKFNDDALKDATLALGPFRTGKAIVGQCCMATEQAHASALGLMAAHHHQLVRLWHTECSVQTPAWSCVAGGRRG